jgi:glycosyltransferase involved in cell wall biosynthesis
VKNLTVAAASAPSIVTIYDLTILACPWLYPPVDVGYWRWIQPHALRRAERIVAISRTTARDLVRYYGLPDAKIEVIYPAASPRFTPQAGDPTAVRRRLRLDGDLIVHVGSISRKKNLPTLIRAFQRLRRRRHGVKLVLAGRVYHKGHDWEIGRRIEEGGGADDIVFTGPVSDEDLPGLYRAAGVVAFPSLHEGFGLVPIEAMACGAPIVASRAGALEEVVSDGGWLVRDNQDDCELADALERLLGDDALRRQLTQRGIQRARSFSPVVTATKTIGLYQQLAGGG